MEYPAYVELRHAQTGPRDHPDVARGGGGGGGAWHAPQDDLADDLAFDEGQPLVPPEVGIGEPVLVQSELIQDRGVDVAEMVGLLIGRARRPMIASVAR